MVDFVSYTTVDQALVPKTLQNIDVAKQDLLNHLYTRKGERVMEPNFGSRIPFLVFEPLDDRTKREIEADIDDIIALDPRWKLASKVVQDGEHSVTVALRLIYQNITEQELVVEYERDTA